MRVRWVGYGRDAAEELRSVIAHAKASDPLEAVTVVVPSNHLAVATRRLLASGVLGPVSGAGRGLIAVDFLTPYRLAELHAAAPLAATRRRPVSTAVIAAALRAALRDEPGVFAPVATHPATEEALVGTYRELRDLDDSALDALAGQGRRAADVVRLHRQARARLAGRWYDEQDLCAAAALALDAGGGPGSVVVYLPQRLSLHMGRMIASAGRRRDITVVAGTCGDAGADAEVLAALSRIGLHAEPAPAAPPPYAAGRTTIVTASDADEEVRTAVRAVVDAARGGTSLDRIAILHASREPYGRLVHEQLAAAGIAANGTAVIPLRERVAARTLLQVLALPAGGFGRADVMAWMSGTPLVVEGRTAPVSAWERLSRRAGVVAGAEQWDRRLQSLAATLQERADRAEPTGEHSASAADYARRDAQTALELRRFVLAVVDRLHEAGRAPKGWSAHCAWARSFLNWLIGDPERAPRRWHDQDEVRAADAVQRALDRLASLDAVEGPVTLDVFVRSLELELDSDLGRTGRFGTGVLVGSIGLGVGLDLDLAVVLGLAEGAFPALVHDDSLLPDRERAATGRELALRRDAVATQHRQLLATLAGAQRQILCVPRGDLRRSACRLPSRWVLDAASHLEGRRVKSGGLYGSERPWLHDVASFAAGLVGLSFPATDQEYRLAQLVRDRGCLDDGRYRSGAQVVEARRSQAFTRFDGNLASVPVVSPVETIVSATRLEAYVRCPMAHLLGHVLGAEEAEDPEDALRISSMDRGSLVHDVLERFVAEGIAGGGRWTDTDRARMRSIGEQLCDEYEQRGRTGRRLYWCHDRARILADLDEFVTRDSERCA